MIPHRTGLFRCLLVAVPGLALCAQAPEGWNRREELGSGLPPGAAWYGAGLWTADRHGPPAPLVDSLGMGNGYVGSGISAEAGADLGRWSFAIQGLADTDAQGRSHFTVMRSHARYHSGGWTAGFEQEPLVWGYGLTGGYLLGESARPVPKLRLETPYWHLSLGKWSLGEWGFQWFTGRLENGRSIPAASQMPLSIASDMALNGDPQSPFFSGWRTQARSRDGKVEFYLNWTVLWGGNRDGVPMTRGYSLGEYLTAITGTKDALAEGGVDFNDPNHPQPTLVNGAASSTNFDVGMRFRADWLARATSSEKAWIYVSRGSKGVLLQWKVLARRPIHYLGKEIDGTWRSVKGLSASAVWNRKDSYVAPNLIAPNDTIGILLEWPGVRFGLEHHDTSNPPGISYRSFVNSVYPSGFYAYGDPLGEALGGEANTTVAKVELDLGSRLSSSTWVFVGIRPFRDAPELWNAAHPSLSPANDAFQGLQQDLAWKVAPAATLRAGASWTRHSAVGWVPGAAGNGFRYFAELAYRWSR
ncbi:capsule assembly Wzi family protein [Mesoterricola silvestris]|uniref:Capsule assembly protein Wzi n=1 Tax=Mesoterricola silvestris TaxID=2927979 RepID=A0AA48GV71_9BACT|nr:capsule assembly Wzi family protein [Mesoterricola silvestris]BDU72421.1 hypothetical protein METEAL_15950 [Mesoterricola silvestris]